jgi:hypothetical protein
MPPRTWPMQSGEDVHQRRLAGAVGAEQRHGLALAHLQVDAMQHRLRAVAGEEVVDAEQLITGRASRLGVGRRAGRERLAEVGLAHARVALDLDRRAGGEMLAGVEDDDLVGDGHHQRHVVLDQEQRHAGAGDSLQQAGEPRLVGTREAGRGLVEQQHLGIERECARDLDQAPVDMRQVGGAGVAPAGIAAEVEQRGGAAAAVVGAQAGGAEQRAEPAATGRQGDVLLHAQAAEELRGLVGAGDAGAGDPPGAAAAERLRAESERSAAGPVIAAQYVEGGGLAGAVGADERGDAGRRGRHRQGVDGAQAAELHRQRHRLEPQARPRREPGRRSGPAGFGDGRRLPQAAAGAAQQADHAVGRDPEHHQQHRAEHQQAHVLEVGEQFGQHADEDRADHRPGHRAGAADHDHEHEQDRLHEAEGVRGDEAGKRREQATRRTRAHGRDREGRALDRHRVEADRLGRGLRVAHRAHRRAPGAAREPGIGGECGAGAEERDQRHRPLAFRQAAEGGRAHAHDAVLPAGEAAPFDDAVLDDEAEGDRDHRQVRPAGAQRGQGEQAAERAGEQRGQRPGEPERELQAGGEQGHRVGADRIEADVAERDLAGQAEQHVEADAGDRQQRHVGENKDVVAVDLQGDGSGAGEQQDRRRDLGRRAEAEQRRPALRRPRGKGSGGRTHTFLVATWPNRPLGFRASATITRLKLRIWVKPEPSVVVISASAMPNSRLAAITPQALVMPPRMATANAFRPNSVPMSALTLKSGAISTPAMPASRVESA